jgi:hypothetical protein
LFPALVPLLSEEKTREVRHFHSLGGRQRLTDLNEFLSFSAHARILSVAQSRSSFAENGAIRDIYRTEARTERDEDPETDALANFLLTALLF